MIDPVPWLIGGGAVHSEEVARTLAYVATGGSSGITDAADLFASELAVPGTSVRTAAGSFSIKNTYAGQTGQSYVGRAPSETTIAVTATGGTVRSDMLVLRIDDPQYGGTTPVDVTVGPYVRLALITNVGTTATEIPAGTAFPAIPLARIDIPVSTATITNAMITDLRKITSPRRERVVQVYTGGGYLTSTVASPGQSWPNPNGFDVLVPEWATQVVVTCSLSGMLIVGNGNGYVWVRMGANAETQFRKTGDTRYDSVAVNDYQRMVMIPAGVLDIDPSLRGTVVNFSHRGYVTAGTGISRPDAQTIATSLLDIEFIEAPTSA